MSTPPTITTARLVLRPIEAADLDAYAEIWSDPVFAEHVGGPADRHQMWHNLVGNAGCWLLSDVGPLSVVERATGDLVGRAGLWNEPGWPGVECVWFIGRRWWGNGYATEAGAASIEWAFDNRPIDEVVCPILPANTRSIAVALRLGLSLERSEFLHGADHNVYTVSRERWRHDLRRPVDNRRG